jgi:ribosomal protein S18 acetylase RimI-like enzyme
MTEQTFNTGDKIIILQAGIKDASLLARICANTFAQTFAADNTPEDMAAYLAGNLTAVKIAAEFDEPGAVFFLAYMDDQPAGMAKMGRSHQTDAPQEKKSMELERLYILPSFQGKRIGTALMQHCIAYAKHKGCDAMWLGVWEHNAKAQQFYASYGFTRYGEHIFQLGSDAQTDWLMMLELN